MDFSNKVENKILDKKILLVEDSNVMRSIIANMLKSEGADIAEAKNGEEAIAVHRKFNPHITLMDINMPIMGGFESIANIRKFSPKSKFIILSSSSRKDEILSARDLKASGYLIKPIDAESLVQRISEVL